LPLNRDRTGLSRRFHLALGYLCPA
jgi:hypothetical protein